MAKRYSYVLPPHRVDYGVDVVLADLKIDPHAQRSLDPRRAQKIADEMIVEALGSLTASERANGDRYTVDGIHRGHACQLNGITTMKGEIHYGLTQQEEAILFLIKNRESKSPNALDEYKVGLTAKLDLFVDTDKVLTAHNLTLGSSSANVIGAVAGVLRITDNYGPEILDRVLTVAEEAWGRTPLAWDGMLLGGLGRFLGRHGDIVTDKEMAVKMAKFGPAQAWVGKVNMFASGGGTGGSGTSGREAACYKLLVDVWNKGRRSAATKIPASWV